MTKSQVKAGVRGTRCLPRVTPGKQRLSTVGEKLGMGEVTIKGVRLLSKKSVRKRRGRRERETCLVTPAPERSKIG